MAGRSAAERQELEAVRQAVMAVFEAKGFETIVPDILQPADAWAAYGLTLAMADHVGMCYMRTFRPDVEFIYDENTIFDLGRFELLTEGKDLLIVTAGFMVHECNKALDALDKMGIDASLVDLYSIPFDTEKLLDIANANGGNILTVEDNYGGGLGAAVAEAFGVRPREVTVVTGERSRTKVLEVEVDETRARARLAELLGPR